MGSEFVPCPHLLDHYGIRCVSYLNVVQVQALVNVLIDLTHLKILFKPV